MRAAARGEHDVVTFPDGVVAGCVDARAEEVHPFEGGGGVREGAGGEGEEGEEDVGGAVEVAWRGRGGGLVVVDDLEVGVAGVEVFEELFGTFNGKDYEEIREGGP